jgi:hypothetical protein
MMETEMENCLRHAAECLRMAERCHERDRADLLQLAHVSLIGTIGDDRAPPLD